MSLTGIGSNPYTATAPSVQTSNYTPYSPYTPSTGDTGGGAFGGDFSSIGSMVANAAGGGFAAHKLGNQMGQNIKSIFGKTFMTGLKNTALTGLKGAGLSALVSAGVSVVTNGVGIASGSTDGSTAVSNIMKDTIGGAVGGLGAVTIGGLGNLALGSLGLAGIPLTIATVAFGAVGGVLGGQLAKPLTDSF
jgi:hypothetical protein